MLSAYQVALRPRAAGHLWVYVQYADALRRLGCDVWWLEELPHSGDAAEETRRISVFLDRLRQFGLADRVILYRTAGAEAPPEAGRPAGLTYLTVPAARAERVLRDADLLLNFHYALAGSVLARFRRTALVDIDPGLLQLWVRLGQLTVHPHDVYFTIGERITATQLDADGSGTAHWQHTPPVVSLDLWPVRRDTAANSFTSVSSWDSREYVVTEDGTVHDNNKRVSFLEHADLPRRTSQRMELALALGPRETSDRSLLERYGWVVRDASAVAGTPEAYRSYVGASRGEFGCAKPYYRLLGNAWLSDRTLCYLASGRPAVVQHTGPSAYLPDGCGLFRHTSAEGAAAAIATINADYPRHCRAAREIAEEYFSATRVLARLLDRALA